MSHPFFHPQHLAWCLTQRRHSVGAELNEEAFEKVPAEAGVTSFKEHWKISCALPLLAFLYPGAKPFFYYTTLSKQ